MRKLKYRVPDEQRMVIPAIYLKADEDLLRLTNTKHTIERRRNITIDCMNEAKRANRTPEGKAYVQRLKKEVDDLAFDIATVNRSLEQKYEEVNQLGRELATIRAEMYIFADCLYNSIMMYKNFANKYANQPNLYTAGHLAELLKVVKQLPFEFERYSSKVNDSYNDVCDRVVDKIEEIVLDCFYACIQEVGEEENGGGEKK